MHKLYHYSALVKSSSIIALCAIVGACSDTTAPASRNAALHLAPATPLASRASASDDPQNGSAPVAVFVIGDSEPSDIGATVNFWGAQWWKNNQMSDTVTAGVASFKGFATTSDNVCGGIWQSRPGNSYDPPNTIDADIAVVVTSTVIKNGAAIHGSIKRIVIVHHDGGYGPNPGHAGNGIITSVVCDDAGTAT
jgi:hypothetical protein